MVIVTNVSEDAFIKKVQELKRLSSNPDQVCFAIGSYYDGKGTDINLAMHLADERMYDDKGRFYAKNPRLARSREKSKPT